LFSKHLPIAREVKLFGQSFCLDVPGVIGKIGTLLGEAEVNISRFYLGREAKGGEALAIIEIDSPLEETVLSDLRNLEAVNVARQVKL
jgi:D-3-phosphoglycerate dehydrogenase